MYNKWSLYSKNEQWLGQLVKNFKSKKIAGVYGKQEPLDTSDPNIVRELNYLFGNDKNSGQGSFLS